MIGTLRDITGLKRAEGELRESEQNYRSIFNAANDAIFVHDMETGRILDANVKTCEMFGYTQEEICNLDVEAISSGEPPFTQKDATKWIKKAAEEGVQVFEWRSKNKQGDLFWAEVSLKKAVIGTQDRVLAIVRDITERKQAEEQLRFMQFAVEHTADAAFWMGPDAKFAYVNEAACRSLGYTRQELLSMTVHDIDPDFPPEVWSDHWKEVKERGSFTIESNHRTKDGRVFPVEIRVNFLAYADNEYNCAFVHDITDRKRAEEELSIRDNAIESSISAIAIADSEGVLTYVNLAFLRMWGYGYIEEVVGRSAIEFWQDEDKAFEAMELSRVVGSWRGELTGRDKYGSEFEVQVLANTVKGEAGKPDYMMASFIDITESKKAEEELQKLATVVRHSSELVNLATLDGMMIFLNEAGGKMLGIDPDEVEQVNIMQVIPDHLKQLVETELLPTLKDSRTWEGELQYRNLKTGEITDVHAITFVVQDPLTSEPLYLANVSRDITERKQAAEALRQSEQEKALILGSLSELITYLDKSLKIVWANKAAGDSVGRSPEELVGGYCYEIWHGRQEACRDCPVVKSIESGQLQEGEITTPDGRVWYMRGCPVINEQGDVVGAVETTLEITQRKRAEEALQTSEQKHKTLVKNIPGMVYRAHPDWSAEIISGSKEICGYTPDELNSRQEHWLGIIHSDDKEEVFEEGARLTKEQTSIVQVYRIIAKSGEERWVEDHKTSLFNQDGQFLGIDGIVFNITERKRIEQDLAAYHEKMHRAEQLASLGTLGATVAHELNQPLTVMRLFLQQGLRALKDDNDGDKVAEVIDDCLSELTNAASIVDRFRRFARKSAPIYIAKVNLLEVANRIVEILAESARRDKLNLSVTVESCPPYIIGNSFELEQMFFVLIQNAIQAADGKTLRELTITISSQGDQVHLTFADTCGGIKEEYIDKIFEPFFTTKPANLGTGLGLCILERIVKSHGGSVRVESRFGRGTIFYICLPIKS
jgi:PAS domain S-box-containing protein